MALYATSLDGKIRLVQTVPGLVRVQDVDAQGRALLLHSLWPSNLACRTPGQPERDLTWLDFSALIDLSADGRKVLFSEDGIAGGGGGAVYVRDVDGGDAVGLGPGEPLALSPDARWVLARSVSDQHNLQLLPTGAGLARRVALGARELVSAAFAADGRALLLRAPDPDGRTRLYALPLAGGSPRLLLDRNVYAAAVSPDGHTAVVGGDDGFHLLALDGSGALRPIPGMTDEDQPIRFDATGAGLYVGRGAQSWDVRRIDLATGAATPLFRVGPQAISGVQTIYAALSADGRTYCYSYPRMLSDLYVVSGLR
jgi:hypothetical protein